MKIAVLTSSRADYSIYLPLLKLLKSDPYFKLTLIVFGTHLSKDYGFTVDQIISDGFDDLLKVETLSKGDSPRDISNSIGNIVSKFSSVWDLNKFDIVFALGDRYEMLASILSSVPFNVKIAHIHGGETTLGAFDDVFRHSISLIAKIHFPTTAQFKHRLENLIGNSNNIFNVGALSIDNLTKLQLLSIEEFKIKFGIDLALPSILITFHPETVSFGKNDEYINEILNALKNRNGFQYIFTMPNSDTNGNLIRNKILNYCVENDNAISVESFGTIGYLSAMKHCSMLLGNTSSGFVEASYFPKYVINLGDRQNGRILTKNIVQCPIQKNQILMAIDNYSTFDSNIKIDIYGEGNSASRIVKILRTQLL
jgi:GDP/UDP-N,N'-diacetylbacillosamine 2-epimerase (hydrolysing)